MTGEPFNEATRALSFAVGRMGPNDRFNLILFDHEEIRFSEELVPCNQENFQNAFQWVAANGPRGGTGNSSLRWSPPIV